MPFQIARRCAGDFFGHGIVFDATAIMERLVEEEASTGQ